MSDNSSIQWTEATWNPVTGCTKISPGCANCYAERMAKRLQGMRQPNYRNGFALTLQPHMLDHPLRWKKPKRIFVNSMSDLFHRDVPVDYIRQVFDVMRQAHWHQFQILTKRASRLAALDRQLEWPENVWMGVSVEEQKFQWRIDRLRKTSARLKFLSIEPLIGPLVALNLDGIDWVIVGGESGPGSRWMAPDWVADILATCHRSQTPFFFKQAGTSLAKHWKCSDAKGGDSTEWPESFRVREYPAPRRARCDSPLRSSPPFDMTDGARASHVESWR